MRKLLVLIAGVAMALGAVAGVAVAGSSSRQSLREPFTTTRRAHTSGMRMSIVYRNPRNPGAKPPAVRKIFTVLQRGTRIDTSVPARCSVSDAQLMAQGAAACPKASRVGGGVITLATGFPAPKTITADVTLINNTRQLIFVAQIRGTPVRQVIRAPVRGRTITTNVPFQPGSPPDGSALKTVNLGIRAISKPGRHGRRAYIRTPAVCPRDRRWVNRGTFTYADGVSQTVRSASPCTRARRHRHHQPRFAG